MDRLPASTRRRFLRTSALGLGAGGLGAFAEEKAAPRPARPKIARFNHYDDAVLAKGEPPSIADGSFTIAVLPDTQRYAKDNPEGFLAQTSCLAESRKRRNIACALHLGDITDNNLPEQWELARRAMGQLDGGLPYFMALGNHDYSEGGVCSDRSTRFNDYFPLSTHGKLPTFGGVYDKEPDRFENSYHLLSAEGRDLLVICLEFGPRKDVVRWANDVAAKHRDRAAILVTHAYMYFDDTRYDWARHGTAQTWNPHSYKVAAATGDDVSDGEELWQNLVSRNPNFILTLNGHVLEDGLGRLSSEASGGRQVHQMLVNFQMRPNGGDAWMRLIEVKADGSASVCDYSPLRDEHNAAAENRFDLRLSPVA